VSGGSDQDQDQDQDQHQGPTGGVDEAAIGGEGDTSQQLDNGLEQQ